MALAQVPRGDAPGEHGPVVLLGVSHKPRVLLGMKVLLGVELLVALLIKLVGAVRSFPDKHHGGLADCADQRIKVGSGSRARGGVLADNPRKVA